jgi:hypothetical protein
MPCDPPKGLVGLLEALIRHIWNKMEYIWNLFEAPLEYSTYIPHMFSRYMSKIYDIYSNYIPDICKIYVE